MEQIPTGFILLVSFAMGSLAYFLAKKRGKNPYFWFFCGSFFGLLGILCLYFFPSKKQQEVVTITPPSPLANKIWYYLDEDMKQCGPISTPALRNARENGVVNNSTYIWNPDLEDWKQLDEIFEKTTSSP